MNEALGQNSTICCDLKQLLIDAKEEMREEAKDFLFKLYTE